MTPEGAKFDKRLREIVAELRGGRTIVADVGGKKFASEFSAMLGDLRKSVDGTKASIADAMSEVKSELGAFKDVERSLREEAAAIRQAAGEILGNNPPESDDA